MTGAETCELALALAAAGQPDAAIEQVAAMQHLRDDDGSYWTGLRLRRRRPLAGRADHLDGGRRGAGRRRARPARRPAAGLFTDPAALPAGRAARRSDEPCRRLAAGRCGHRPSVISRTRRARRHRASSPAGTGGRTCWPRSPATRRRSSWSTTPPPTARSRRCAAAHPEVTVLALERNEGAHGPHAWASPGPARRSSPSPTTTRGGRRATWPARWRSCGRTRGSPC